ncbi:MAG TPA: DUF2079 domain-containing protein, partial [Candidatus Sulfotelmatobacter sp.]|nr:DUF2079 domain-containing protein [Candidatus Sulfotelmatobacter sp.]
YDTTNYIGLLFGSIGIAALYFIAKKLFNEKVALLSSILLAISGLYLSVALFSIHDFLMTVFILLAFVYYLNSRYILYALFACIAVLTKETAVFFALSILLSDIFIKKHRSFWTFAPIVILFWYIEFIHFAGYHLWNDWNFSPTASKGSIYTMINNLVTLKIFNKYAYENWLHLFIFNFNWVYWLFAIGSFFYIKTAELKKSIAPIGIFFVIFMLTVLSFQTFTINRYILPLLPFLYLFASFGVSKLKWQPASISLLIIISLVSLAQSIDPISNFIWQKTQLLDESVYINHTLDGDDGITYNLQYLDLMKTRTDMILNNNCNFPELIKTDTQTLSLLHVSNCNK